MWERCSFYGMRALLILFMTAAVAHGGMGLDDRTAGAIYGLYTAAVYLAALPGGWVADRLLGAQQAVWYGGVLIAAGQFMLAVPRRDTFFIGLILVVLGTGLLKPNVSTLVGQLYPEGGARRDAGFTLFYMGINLGAAIGPLICGLLGEKVNWHLGFAAAGLGMVFGLVQFRVMRRHLTGGQPPGDGLGTRRRDQVLLIGALVLLAGVVGLVWSGQVPFSPTAVARATKWVIMGLAVVFFVVVLGFGGLTTAERKRVGVIAILFVSSALFWSGFEQAGSSFSLFAERQTLRRYFGWEMPAGWFQMVGPVFIIGLAPVAAALWVALARRGRDPSLPAKFAMGLALLGVGFLVIAWGARRAEGGGLVWPTWLIATFLIHTFAELCVSPVGLSSVTKLAPPRLVGQMMGVWFLATSLGNLIAGLIAGEVSGETPGLMTTRFLQIVAITGGTAVVLFLLARPVRRLMGGVQ